MRKEKNKTNFFVKIYYSIFSLKKYSELNKFGWKNAIAYLRNITLILAIVYATVMIIHNIISINKLKNCLESSLPEFTYENGKLFVESDEKVVIDDEIVITNFGGRIIIDTSSEYENIKEDYAEELRSTIIFTSDKYLTIHNGEIKEFEYNTFIEKYFSDDVTTINKEDIIDLFKHNNYLYYFIMFMILYLAVSMAMVLAYDVIISFIAFIILKIRKSQLKFGEIFSTSIYSSTILTLGTLIVVFMNGGVGNTLQILLLILTVIYMVRALKCNLNTKPQ